MEEEHKSPRFDVDECLKRMTANKVSRVEITQLVDKIITHLCDFISQNNFEEAKKIIQAIDKPPRRKAFTLDAFYQRGLFVCITLMLAYVRLFSPDKEAHRDGIEESLMALHKKVYAHYKGKVPGDGKDDDNPSGATTKEITNFFCLSGFDSDSTLIKNFWIRIKEECGLGIFFSCTFWDIAEWAINTDRIDNSDGAYHDEEKNGFAAFGLGDAPVRAFTLLYEKFGDSHTSRFEFLHSWLDRPLWESAEVVGSLGELPGDVKLGSWKRDSQNEQQRLLFKRYEPWKNSADGEQIRKDLLKILQENGKQCTKEDLWFHGTAEPFAKSIEEDGIDLQWCKTNQDFGGELNLGKSFYVGNLLHVACDRAAKTVSSCPNTMAAVLVFDMRECLKLTENLVFEKASEHWERYVKSSRLDHPNFKKAYAYKICHTGIEFVRGPALKNPGLKQSDRAKKIDGFEQIGVKGDAAIEACQDNLVGILYFGKTKELRR